MSNTNSIKRNVRWRYGLGKSFFRFITGFLIIWFSGQGVMAQTRTITGTVKDNKGEVVIGASVALKGTSTGTYTDAEGNFTIVTPSNGGTLIVKYLGYKTAE